MNDLISDLCNDSSRNIQAVHSDDLLTYRKEYEEVMNEVDRLCLINDPSSTPFQSRYKARDLLTPLVRKLEAQSVIAKVDKEIDRKVARDLQSKVASIRVKLGSIAYDCEEPHVTENELSIAIDYYYPNLNNQLDNYIISYLNSKNDIQIDGIIDSNSDVSIDPNYLSKFMSSDLVNYLPNNLSSYLPNNELISDLSNNLFTLLPDNISNYLSNELTDSLKCLNLLGVLWAGRGVVNKAFIYLFTVKYIYNQIYQSNYLFNHLTIKQIEGIENIYTHTLFYLAQLYSGIDLFTSCRYCQETLRRQLVGIIKNNYLDTVYEWVKNCSGISDFYLSMRFYYRCNLSLQAALDVLNKYKEKSIDNNIEFNNYPLDLESDIYRKLAKLDETILKKAYDRETYLSNYLSNKSEDGLNENNELDLSIFHDDDIDEDRYADTLATTFRLADLCICIGLNVVSRDLLYKDFMPGLTIHPFKYLSVRDITSFDIAREIYLRAIKYIDLAKKYYVLDGFVSDHVSLLMSQSKLYLYLSIFESDRKRKLAMYNKRIELLAPLLTQLNKSVYEAFHKQISYELGEIFIALLDLKLEKFRNRSSNNNSIDQLVNKSSILVESLKKSEINKVNSYCINGIVYFLHFISIYLSIDTTNNLTNYLTIYQNTNQSNNQSTINELSKIITSFISNDLSTNKSISISISDIRPFFNSFFLISRLVGKILPNDSKYLVISLSIYKWIVNNYIYVCNKLDIKIDNNLNDIIDSNTDNPIDKSQLFTEEFNICTSMIELLPSKIDRMVRYGETGLSL